MYRPNIPVRVNAIPDDAFATVFWTAPTTDVYGNDITGEIIQYTVTSSPDNQRVNTRGSTITKIFGLRIGVPYTFTVTARNNYGVSDNSLPSDPIIPFKKTLSDPPINLNASTRPNSLLLSWSRPLNNGGSSILYYTITLLDSVPIKRVIFTPPTNNDTGSYSYLWNNLLNNTSYSFSISCTTSLGNSFEAYISANPSDVPYPPTNVYLENASDIYTSAIVYWTPPVMDIGITPIISYTIVVQPSITNSPVIVGPNETSKLIEGLNPFVGYYFYVYATNSAGDSLNSSIVGPNHIIQNSKPVNYKKFVTGGNDPSISKRMLYAYSIGRLRKSQYINYGGGAAFYT